MDPHGQFCHNRRCRAYGRSGAGHVVIHSQKECRYRCKRCGRTFTETKDTAFYRMHKPRWLVLAVMTLLSYGCPVQAIVAAFDVDERTVARWQRQSGSQCRRVHEHLVEAGKVALLQVQADEIRVKAVGGVFWLASAMEVRSRLWLGSVISQHRDGRLIGGLLIRVRACGPVENPAGNRRALKLQEPSSEGLQGGASHRQGRPSEADAWHRGDDRQGHKALPA
jgi:transposase-like protein